MSADREIKTNLKLAKLIGAPKKRKNKKEIRIPTIQKLKSVTTYV